MMAREGLMGTHVSPSASLMLEKHAEKTKFLFILEAKYPVFPGFFSQSVGIMQN